MSEKVIFLQHEKGEQLEQIVQRGYKVALEKIQDQYENQDDPDRNLDYHNAMHTEGVVKRIDIILDALQQVDTSLVTEKERSLARLSGAFHDVVQKYYFNEVPSKSGIHTKVIRSLKSGESEDGSAYEAVKFINSEDEISSIFTEQDKQVVQSAIKGTQVVYDLEKSAVVQQHITSKSSIVEHVVALADLGSAGMEDAKTFIHEGDALFREENVDITRSFRKSEILNDEKKRHFRSRMMHWIQSQEAFIQGRKNETYRQVQMLPDEVRKTIQNIFDRYDTNKVAVQEKYKERNKMTFEELAQDMGYTVESKGF